VCVPAPACRRRGGRRWTRSGAGGPPGAAAASSSLIRLGAAAAEYVYQLTFLLPLPFVSFSSPSKETDRETWWDCELDLEKRRGPAQRCKWKGSHLSRRASRTPWALHPEHWLASGPGKKRPTFPILRSLIRLNGEPRQHTYTLQDNLQTHLTGH
jgi:hypothetical protein